MNKKQTIVILSASAGAGHVRAAQAIKETADTDYPSLHVIHLDVMDFVPKLFKKFYAEYYIKIVQKHPELWGYLYQKTDKKINSILDKIKLEIEKLNTKKLISTIDSLNPDQIICTHFLAAELLSKKTKKNEFDKPIWVQVTDFDIHMFWVHPHIKGYFVANEEIAFRLKNKGVNSANIYVTGIPIMPIFSKTISKKDAIASLKINAKKNTLLMMAGGYGVGDIDKLTERLLKINENFQIICLAGKNKMLLNKLKRIAKQYPEKLFPMGFTNEIEKIMSVSNIAITKTGGLTTSECLALGLPIIVISPIPGQEERNADYLLENGAALKACDEAGLEYRVRLLLKNKKRLSQMRTNALNLSKPEAANNVLEIISKK